MNQPVQLDTDILNTMLFRLLFRTQDDRYEAETALHLLRGLVGLDEESGRVTVRLWAMNALIDLEGQRLMDYGHGLQETLKCNVNSTTSIS